MNRWVINRVGLLNFWYYKNQIFELANGRMLLRGANGSGKSLTMQSLFPVLFDGNTSAYRLDSFGSADRRMEDYLLGEKGVSDRDEGIGYLFLEVKREHREEYLTVGIGMHANRGGKLNKWFFALENNERVGLDFELYEELRKGELTPLTKQKLKNRLEHTGKVFESGRAYKSYVNERIFGFDSLEQFDELINLLINLRSPKLSKEFRPTVIYNILRDSLPKLKDDELLTLSKTIEQLDGHRERLEDLTNELRELNKFSKTYERWHDELVGQLAGKWLALSKQKRKLEKESNDRKVETAQMQANYDKKYEEHTDNETHLEAIDLQIQELAMHEGINLVSRGQELQEQLDDTVGQLAKTEQSLARKKQQLTVQRSQLDTYLSKQDENVNELNLLLTDNKQYVSYLRFEELDDVYSTKILNQLTKNEFNYWKEQVNQKKQHFQRVIKSLQKLEQLEAQFIRLRRDVGDAQQKVDELNRDIKHWQQIRQHEIENWKLGMDNWRKNAAFPLQDNDYAALLHQMDRLLEDEIRKELILYPLANSYDAAKDENQLKRNTLRSHLADLQVQKDEIVIEIAEWQGKKVPEIEQRDSRKVNRLKLAERHALVTFYQSVDFLPHVSESNQNKIEGALYASGILDSLISETGLTLADDLQILPEPKLLAVTLADFLHVNDTVEKTLQPLVMDILQSIIVDEDDPELPAVFLDGSYQIANLRGQMPTDYQASYIGAASQERYRQMKIAQLENDMNEIVVQMADLKKKIEEKNQFDQQIKASYEGFPNGNEVYQAIDEIKDVTYKRKYEEEALQEKLTELDKVDSQVNKEKIDIHQRTMQDGLTLNIASYEDAYMYANNYDENLNDAYRYYEVIAADKKAIHTIETGMSNLSEEEENLRVNLSELTAKKQKQQRTVEDNDKQQKLMNVEALQMMLSQAKAEQKERKATNKSLQISMNKLIELIASNNARLENVEKDLNDVNFSEGYWKELFDKEVHRFTGSDRPLDDLAKEKARESSIKKLKELEGQIITQFNFLADQLQNYQPQLMNMSVIDLSEEKEQGLNDFAQYNNYKQPHFKTENETKSTFALLEFLTEQRMTLQDLLKKDDEQLFKNIILESVGNILRVRIQQAMQWVEQMNQLLQSQKNSSGLSLSIQWKGLPSASDQDLGTVRLVELLQKPTNILSNSDREAISRHFQEKVSYAQEQLEENPDDQSTLFQAIAKVLDYRDWFQFELKYKRANEGYRPQVLTDRRFNQFSGGEKAIVMYLPLFASVDSKYSDAGEFCPKIITLDEAFAGIDDLNIAELFKACHHLDFNYVMNSQFLFGDYETVSELMIYELLRPQNINFVTAIRYYWDGQQRHMMTEELFHES